MLSHPVFYNGKRASLNIKAKPLQLSYCVYKDEIYHIILGLIFRLIKNFIKIEASLPYGYVTDSEYVYTHQVLI